MLKDGGVIPQPDGKHHAAMEAQNPGPVRDREQARITMIARHMVRRSIERQRFFAEPLSEMDETVMAKQRHSRRTRT
jgi:hypothetical protein